MSSSSSSSTTTTEPVKRMTRVYSNSNRSQDSRDHRSRHDSNSNRSQDSRDHRSRHDSNSYNNNNNDNNFISDRYRHHNHQNYHRNRHYDDTPRYSSQQQHRSHYNYNNRRYDNNNRHFVRSGDNNSNKNVNNYTEDRPHHYKQRHFENSDRHRRYGDNNDYDDHHHHHRYHHKSDKTSVTTTATNTKQQLDNSHCQPSVSTIGNDRHSDTHEEDDVSTVDANDNNLQQTLDEITALKSIFDDTILTIDEQQLKGRFLAEVVISDEMTVFYSSSQSRHKSAQKLSEEFRVKHLPPIELYFELPKTYPSQTNPRFLISCKWLLLNQLESICDKLERIWKDMKMEVLFTWFSFLQNDLMDYLNIRNMLDITPLLAKPVWVNNRTAQSSDGNIQSESHVMNLKPAIERGGRHHDRRAACDRIGVQLITHLRAYNEYKCSEVFNKSYHLCNICFSSHSGQDCVVFPCKHINCRNCIRGYFSTLVKEGTVNLLKCPETDCQTTAPPQLVRQLVSKELFERYDQLMLDTIVSSMQDAHYCPRKICGALVIGDTDSSLAHCTTCGHAFCKNCKFTYHGVDPCNIFRDAEQRKIIVAKYTEADDAEKSELEKLYGKKQLAEAIEQAATDKWMEDMAKRCPHCKATIEKSDGCNKMSCWRCNTYFCWLCLETLPVTQPYSHFSNPASKCYNQLFLGVNMDIDDMFDDFFI
ncbi:E3 ubiquitin-protein ligase RNF14-like [Oppia nitens]|uniref:E3 ubiquitin-protein ligase RNF14-like n=1 Tax=Oppia nitens TaxID=1686743 RepID=UPI0023DCBE35|nr:E3 ubiquitin-protein ligase RNF14-like [Oppia nitens]